MAIDVAAIQAEIASVRGALRVSWSAFANYCQAKMLEAAIAGGVASYSIGGRSVNRDLRIWQEWYDYAISRANAEAGGVTQQPIYFRSYEVTDRREPMR